MQSVNVLLVSGFEIEPEVIIGSVNLPIDTANLLANKFHDGGNYQLKATLRAGGPKSLTLEKLHLVAIPCKSSWSIDRAEEVPPSGFGNHVFSNGVCKCGQKTTDDPASCDANAREELVELIEQKKIASYLLLACQLILQRTVVRDSIGYSFGQEAINVVNSAVKYATDRGVEPATFGLQDADGDVPTEKPKLPRSPLDIATSWYDTEGMRKAIMTAGDGSFGDAGPIPGDVKSVEFADWMTDQYRLAMSKGIQLGRNKSEG